MNIAENLTELIGSTPLLRLSRFAVRESLPIAPIAKLEYFNPAGSVKDRVALSMIEDAERRGLLHKGSVIIEPTSGNTGIGLAFICSVKGYRLVLTMPDTMSRERISLLRAYGAEVVLTPGERGMAGAIEEAELICSTVSGSLILQQFENAANPYVHYRTTAEEIWRDTDGTVDVFVSGVGTGGTITGVGRRLKELNPHIHIVAVEPSESPVLSGGERGVHKLQGIGAGFVPKIYDAGVVDEVALCEYKSSVETVRSLAQSEGMLVGFSSGAALNVAARMARKPEYQDKNIVVLLPDGGERYLSTELF